MKRVIERFPELEREILHLFETDDVFRELCDEYLACGEAADRLGASREAMRREYSALRLRLEAELLRYFQEHPGQ